jgi:ribosomal protein L11 methyltransferase
VSGRWLVLSARGFPADHAGLVAEGLMALGGGAVEERAGESLTWLAPPGDAEAFVAGARAALLRELPAGSGLELEWRWQEDQDWAADWKRGLAPR